MAFFEDLRERKLVRWVIAYVAAGWAVVQLFDVMGPRWGLTDAALRGIDVAVAVGFFLTLILAWYHGEQGRQAPSFVEVALVGLVLAIGGVSVALVVRAPFQDNQPAIPAPSATEGLGVAVLPLENLSPDPSDAYLADGLHEEITGQLGKVSSLFVVARASVLRFEDSNLGVREVALQLGVDYVITGSVRTAGENVRLAAQLVDGRTEEHLWSETYDRDLTVEDLFAIQSDLADKVAQALSARIRPDEAAQLAVRPTTNTEAYQYYLRGLSHWGRRTAIESRIAATDAFAAATRLDPQFGEAWAMLASSSLFLRWYDANGAGDRLAALGLSVDSLLAEAEVAVRIAEQFAPGVAVTELARGNLLYHGLRDFEGALAIFTEAAERFPNNSGLAGAIGNVNRRFGRYEEALEWYLRAASLGPSPQGLYTAGQTAQMMRSYSQALELAAQATTLAPDFGPALGVKFNAYLMAGDTATAFQVVSDFEQFTGALERGRRVEIARFRRGHVAALQEFRSTFEDDRSSARYLYLLRQAGQEVPVEAAAAGVLDARRRLVVWEGVTDPFVALLARSDLALALAVAGQTGEARLEAARVLSREPMRQDALIGWTAVDAALRASLLAGDLELAVQAAESLLTLPSFRSVDWFRLDPTYQALWSSPSFRELVEPKG